MTEEKNDNQEVKGQAIKFKVRFDYRGRSKPPKLFFGGKNSENSAEDLRDQQMALWRNIPIQGVKVENIDLGEIYSVYDEELEDEVAYAPMELLVSAHNLEDLVRFIVREEFRRIEFLEPETLELNKQLLEKLFFKMNEEMRNQIQIKAKKYKE